MMGPGWTVNIASNNLDLQLLLEQAKASKGTEIIQGRTLDETLTAARAYIDRLLSSIT
jgi:hypothetical protein